MVTMRPLLLLIILSSALTGQTRERFELRGMHLGDSVTTEIERAQRLRCHETPGSVYGDESCMAADTHFAGVETFLISVETVDRKISAFRIDFSIYDSKVLLDAFTARWGKPDSTASRDWQNQMGAKFPNPVSLWQLSDGTLEVAQFGPSMRTSEAGITLKALLDVQTRKNQCSAARASLKDLGGKLPEGCAPQSSDSP